MSDMEDHCISFFLNLAPTFNDKWRQIYHLLYLRSRSINLYISKEWRALKYITFNDAKQEVIWANQGSIMVKRNLKDVFWYISMSL